MPYRYSLIYQPGKNDLNPADYLSCHPHHKPEKDNAAEAYISYVVQNTIPKSIILEEVKKATEVQRRDHQVIKNSSLIKRVGLNASHKEEGSESESDAEYSPRPQQESPETPTTLTHNPPQPPRRNE